MSDLVQNFTGTQSARHVICVTIDGNYLPYGLFVLDQIAALHPAPRDFDLCIVTTGPLPDHPLTHDLGVRICTLRSDALSGFPRNTHIPVATFMRLHCARALVDYDRILYLDCDLFIRRGDFEALLNVDMGPHPVARARDPFQFRHPNRIPKDMKKLGLGAFKYLSAGVQLIDTKRYNELEIGEQALAMGKARPDDLLTLDQSAINAVLQGGFGELPPGWNWLYGFRTIYFTELYDPPILHFAGRRKPWNTLNGEFPERYSAVYRAFFNTHFPELAAAMPPFTPPSKNRKAHLRYLFNHINGLRTLLPAFDQFTHDLDIKL